MGSAVGEIGIEVAAGGVVGTGVGDGSGSLQAAMASATTAMSGTIADLPM
jgi:hypothetical protein